MVQLSSSPNFHLNTTLYIHVAIMNLPKESMYACIEAVNHTLKVHVTSIWNVVYS